MMDSKLDWTQKLGDAFLAQQKDLMDAIQRLRAKAQASGNLKSTAEQTVTVQPAAAAPAPPPPPVAGQPRGAQQVIVQQAPPTVITIVPTNPQVVYVPTYNPTVVYGAWPYPAYPPYAYYPPGYVAGVGLFSFAAGVAVGGALWGNCNWGGGDVNININQYNSYTKNVNNDRRREQCAPSGRATGRTCSTTRRIGAGPSIATRRPSRDTTGAAIPQATQSRENFRGRAEQGRQDIARGGGASGFQRIGSAATARRPAGGRARRRRWRSASGRPARAAAAARGAPSRAWGRVREAQASSNRGQSSRQSSMSAGGGSSRQSSMSSGGGSRAQSRPTGGSSGGASRGGGGGRGGGGRR